MRTGLAALAALGAPRLQRDVLRCCSFHQPVPLVSYLIVLTAGVIEYSAIDARTGVWAEPSLSSAVRGCRAGWDVTLRGIYCCAA